MPPSHGSQPEKGRNPAFGISASQGRLLLTIRGEYEEELDRLNEWIEEKSKHLADQYGLELSIGYRDVFPMTFNHKESNDKIRTVCVREGITLGETAVDLFRGLSKL